MAVARELGTGRTDAKLRTVVTQWKCAECSHNYVVQGTWFRASVLILNLLIEASQI